MEFRILGPVEVLGPHGEHVDLGRQMQRALLALLLLNANREVPKDRIDACLWPGREPPRAETFNKNVQNLRAALRTAFDGVVFIPPLRGASRINVAPECMDHHRFLSALGCARAAEEPAMIAEYARRALDEWRGAALQNLDDANSWVAGMRQSLDELRMQAWQLWFDAELALGRHASVLGEIAEPLALRPWDETLIRQWMLALYRAGRTPDALAAYQDYRTYLLDDGLTPSAAVQELQLNILNADSELDRDTLESPDVSGGVLSGLPRRPLLVGRDAPLHELTTCLNPTTDGANAVVVSGMAGVGKTALAVRAAHDARDAGWYPGGVVFLDLHGYQPDFSVTGERAITIALSELGVPAERMPPGSQERRTLYRSTLARLAVERQWVLIVADNASCGAQVRALIPAEAGHRLLVTSRDTLADLDETRLLELDIRTPAAGVRMVATYLHAAVPGDDRITREPAAAAEIVRLCGWLPLALRVISAILAADPDQRLADLTDELTDAKHRLTRLRYDDALQVSAAFELSYARLRPPQARLFRLLALNPGTQTSTAAAAALIDSSVAEARRLLLHLRRAHLLDSGDRRGWWRLHDLLYLYAREHLRRDTAEDRDEAVGRLFEHYATTVRAATRYLDPAVAYAPCSARFTSRADALGWLDAEHSTVVASLGIATATGRDRYIVDVAEHLHHYFELRRYFIAWVGTHRCAVRAAERMHQCGVEAAAYRRLGEALRRARQFAEAELCLTRALSLYRPIRDSHGAASTLSSLGNLHQDTRRFTEAFDCFNRALPLHRAVHDRYGEAVTWNHLGSAFWNMRRFTEAVDCHGRALALYRESGDRLGEAASLTNLGTSHLDAGCLGEAVDYYLQALPLHVALDDRGAQAATLTNVGRVFQRTRRLADAVRCHEHALALWREVRNRWGEAAALDNLGAAYQVQGRLAAAIVQHRSAVAIFRAESDGHRTGQALRKLGAAWLACGDEQRAGTYWRQALVALNRFPDPAARRDVRELHGLLDTLDD